MDHNIDLNYRRKIRPVSINTLNCYFYAVSNNSFISKGIKSIQKTFKECKFPWMFNGELRKERIQMVDSAHLLNNLLFIRLLNKVS